MWIEKNSDGTLSYHETLPVLIVGDDEDERPEWATQFISEFADIPSELDEDYSVHE